MKRIQIILLSLIVIFLVNCSKDKDNDDLVIPSDNSDTLMIDLLTEVSDPNKTFMDIAPLPLPDELNDYAETDTGFQAAINAMDDFNDMIQNPGILLGISMKSTQTDNWELVVCEDYGTTSICSWKSDRGEYMYHAEQTTSFNSVVLDISISGTRDGIFYAEKGSDEPYTISEWSTVFNDLQLNIIIYNDPVPEYLRDQPVFSYLYIVAHEGTVYQWGERREIINVTFQSTIHSWNSIKQQNVESLVSLVNWEGDLLTTVLSSYCANYEAARPHYGSTYNFDTHEGSWCHFDCNGIPFACGDY